MPAPPTLPEHHVHFLSAALALAGQGYQMSPPPWLLPASLAIDRQCAAEGSCEYCGRQGLRLEPFYNARKHTCRALAVCLRCRHVCEF